MLNFIFMIFPVFALTPGHIEVSGECRRSLTPDRGRITVSERVIEPTLKAATEKATKSYEAVLAEIKSLNLKDVEFQTTEYRSGENHVYERNRTIQKGYYFSVGVLVSTSDVSKLKKVMEIAVKHGMSNTSGLQTFVSDQKRKDEYNSCLADAVKDARAKAEKMAQASGARVGELSAIDERKGVTGGPRVFAESAMMMAKTRDASAPEIETAEQNFEVEIQVMFKIR